MRQHQSGIDGERAQHLLGLVVFEAVETALEHFAVERDDARTFNLGSQIEEGGVRAKRLFDILAGEALQGIADRGVRRSPLPFDFQGFVEPFQMHPDERFDAAIRIRAADDGKNGKQQAGRATRRACPRPNEGRGSWPTTKQKRPATARQPPADSVASQRFRLFAARESSFSHFTSKLSRFKSEC